VIAFLVVLFLLIPGSVGFLVDLWFFRDIGYQIVYTKEISTRFLVFLGAGGVTTLVLYLNLALAQRGVVPDPIVFRLAPSAPGVDLTRVLRRLALPVAVVFGLLFGLGASPSWELVLRVLYGTSFGVADPVFARDVGYYVFTLPGIAALIGFLSSLAVISLLFLVPIYLLRGDIVVRNRQLRVEPSAGVHLAILLAALLALTAVRLWLVDIPSLLYSNTGPLVGASYTDLHATLPALRISAVLALLAAVAVIVGAARQRLAWYALWSGGA